jgi:hypothetical protein
MIAANKKTPGVKATEMKELYNVGGEALFVHLRYTDNLPVAPTWKLLTPQEREFWRRAASKVFRAAELAKQKQK